MCFQGFNRKETLIKHRCVPRGENTVECTVCGKNFKEMGQLTKHLRVHSVDKPLECSACGKGFSRKSDLVRHLEIHAGSDSFECSLCGKHFNRKDNLTQHHLRVHQGEKTLECATWGNRSFWRRIYLTKSILVRSQNLEGARSVFKFSNRFEIWQVPRSVAVPAKLQTDDIVVSRFCKIYAKAASKLLQAITGSSGPMTSFTGKGPFYRRGLT